jgi:TonB family protein
MFELKPVVQKSARALFVEAKPRPAYDPKQRRLMVVALAMLLIALGFVLYRDRDFWFPEGQEAEAEQPAETVGAADTEPLTAMAGKTSAPAVRSKHRPIPTRPDVEEDSTAAGVPPITAIRTVLPPLEVEVVAGDSHRTLRPGSNSVKVDLQPGTSPQAAQAPPEAAVVASEIPAEVTTNASEKVQMSPDTAEVVRDPVKPGYPMLARQMKVQGSVILQALIGRDGAIQTLRVVSGPPILASAAQAAVRQWHFKPHYSGNEPVETQAKITVNFTISTN